MNAEQIRTLEAEIREKHGNICGITVSKGGEMLYEGGFGGCSAGSRMHVYSVTKSIVSALIGIAIDRGCIEGADQRVGDFFPEYGGDVRIGDLMTMTAPFHLGLFPPYVRYFKSGDFLSFTLSRLGRSRRRTSGRKFSYTPLIGPDILTGILSRAAGRPVLDFADEVLFGPLGIKAGRSIVFESKQQQLDFNASTDVSGWVSDGCGLNTGGWGLCLSARDMNSIGRLYLNGGLSGGKRVLPEAWAAESTREHSRWKRQNLGYGYLWWIIDGDEGACAAIGDGGNVIYFNRSKELAVSITASYLRGVYDRVDFIRERIEPML